MQSIRIKYKYTDAALKLLSKANSAWTNEEKVQMEAKAVKKN